MITGGGEGGNGGLRELENEVLVAEPGHRSVRGISESSVNEERIAGTLVEGDGDAVLSNLDGASDVEEVIVDRFGLGPVVLLWESCSEEAIEGTGHEGKLQIEINLKADHRCERIDMEEMDGFSNGIFNKHTVGVARDEGGGLGFEVVG